jgi:hypothetical protein
MSHDPLKEVPLNEVTITPSQVYFSSDRPISIRPLSNLPDDILKNAFEGLVSMPDHRLSSQGFKQGDCICAVSVAAVNAVGRKKGISFSTARRLIEAHEESYAGALTDTDEAGLPGNWVSLSSSLNDRFGMDCNDPNHPVVQKARYFYVYGVVASEMALRGLI